MNIREFQLSWKKGFVNIYGKKITWNRWTCWISFFPPYLIEPHYQAGGDQLTLVFVPFLLFQSTSWNYFLILQRSSILDFLLIVTCKSNKYKRRVQNMPFLECGYLSNITRKRHKDRFRFMILTASWLAQVKHERKGKVTQLVN